MSTAIRNLAGRFGRKAGSQQPPAVATPTSYAPVASPAVQRSPAVPAEPVASATPGTPPAPSEAALSGPDQAETTVSAQAQAATPDFTQFLRVALRLLPTPLLAESLRTGCPWSQALPPAGRRQFAEAVDHARRSRDADLETLLADWRHRSSLFTR